MNDAVQPMCPGCGSDESIVATDEQSVCGTCQSVFRSPAAAQHPLAPWAPATKNELLELLSGIRSGFLYGHVVAQLAGVHSQQLIDGLRGKRFFFEGRPGDYVMLGLDLLADHLDGDPKSVPGNFFLMLEYEVVRISYEAAHAYCRATGQIDQYRREPAMRFARLWRNVVAHGAGAVLTEWPRSLWEKGIIEARWRDHRLRASDVGTVVSLGVVECLRLQEDIHTFCRDKLT